MSNFTCDDYAIEMLNLIQMLGGDISQLTHNSTPKDLASSILNLFEDLDDYHSKRINQHEIEAKRKTTDVAQYS